MPGAIKRAARNRYLEFPGQIRKFMIAKEMIVHPPDKRFGVYEFRAVDPGKRAASDVAGNIPARSCRRQSHFGESLEDGGHVFNANVMELDALAGRHIAGVFSVTNGKLP